MLSALQCGYRLIDTANAYVNEKAVGRGMKKSGLKREDIFLETKIWPAFYEQADAVEKTLERLDTDYIDLLLIHQPAGNYVAGYRQMEKAYKEGKVRAIGLSNFNEAQIRENPWHLRSQTHCIANGSTPLFTGEGAEEIPGRRGHRHSGVVSAGGHGDKTLIQEPLFAELGKKYGKTSAQIILRWHIQDGNIVIPRLQKSRAYPRQFDLFDFSLSDAEMAEIAKLDKQKRYYVSTPEMLKAYVNMVPDVDG